MAYCVVVPLGPACVDITGVRAGDQNEFTMHLHRGGVPLDLTGLTFTAQARKKSTDPDPPALTAVVTVTDALNGDLTVAWPGEDVRALLNGKATWTGVWDLQADDGTNDPTTLAAGNLAAQMDVTR